MFHSLKKTENKTRDETNHPHIEYLFDFILKIVFKKVVIPWESANKKFHG